MSACQVLDKIPGMTSYQLIFFFNKMNRTTATPALRLVKPNSLNFINYRSLIKEIWFLSCINYDPFRASFSINIVIIHGVRV